MQGGALRINTEDSKMHKGAPAAAHAKHRELRSIIKRERETEDDGKRRTMQKVEAKTSGVYTTQRSRFSFRSRTSPTLQSLPTSLRVNNHGDCDQRRLFLFPFRLSFSALPWPHAEERAQIDHVADIFLKKERCFQLRVFFFVCGSEEKNLGPSARRTEGIP